MRELYPSSTGRTAAYLQDILEELVLDATRADPDSRQFHAVNPLVEELDRTMGIVRRADTRPWKGDVRQAGAVEAGKKRRGGGLNDLPERDETELVFGKPDDIELRELRRYPNRGIGFMNRTGGLADTIQVIESGGELLIGAESRLHRVTENGEQNALDPDPPAEQWHLTSTGPGEHRLLPAQGALDRSVAVQREGLDVHFAGRGTFQIDVTFTGIQTLVVGTEFDDATAVFDVSGNTDTTTELDGTVYFEEGLNLYGPDGDTHTYTVADDEKSLTIDGAEVGDEMTFYYRGSILYDYDARASARLDQLPAHSVSLADHASVFAELPDEDKIDCTATARHLAACPIQGRTIGVTKGGYVGNTYLGHPVEHVLPGPRHVLALGGGTLSICEPEAVGTLQFAVPDDAVGITWTDEGLLGLVREEGNELVLYGLNENRQGHTDGFTTIPPMGR